MKAAAIGVRMHSGWGAVVSVAGAAEKLEVIDRRRIAVIEGGMNGISQPYHRAAKMALAEAEKYLAECAAVSGRLALASVRGLVEELKGRGYRVAGVAVLLAAGRPLPPLANILAAHSLIHTAEGEFFRGVVRQACVDLKMRVTGIREREIDERAKAVFGRGATRVQRRIAGLGKSLGPPWTQDQKSAALAAAMMLSGRVVVRQAKFKSGVTGLGSNKKHLRDFGRDSGR